ncbi:helix-turn-helix transcriptional regulator [Streptomyces sp. NRRL S-350]|uniref:helix-turn-helix transcriptional regulator n=1 Tax=Streptomyces sp. NRRL S-350 TaxID=1463902 RepID=UPI0004C23AF4|nr:LuxR C-terminal-related transcriptional regulator [Streptomyces sp. NRRL S-350]
MAASLLDRRTAGLVDRCYAGSDPARLRAEVLPRLRRLVPADAVFFATVDPASLLFTSVATEEPLAGETARFLENEFGRSDVNKFADLARAADPVGTLGRATRGDLGASPRYREIMAPLGLGDELRVALRLGGCCWGVLCLHRERAGSGFDGGDVAVLRAVAPHLAEGIRRSVALGLAGSAAAQPRAAAPGVLVLDAGPVSAAGPASDAGPVLLSASEEARDWLARLEPADFPPGARLPIAVSAVAARLARLEREPADAVPPPSVRVRDRFGGWWSLHATRLTGAPRPQIAVVVEPAPPQQRSTLLLSAYGLSPAQNRVATLVLRGCSTREISAELCISANTVQEHLTAVFDRLGVRSRRELVALALAGAGR